MLGVPIFFTVYAPCMCKDHPFSEELMAAWSGGVVRLDVFV